MIDHTGFPRALSATFILAALSGCLAPDVGRAPQSPAETEIGPLEAPASAGPVDGTCFASATTPAVIETVTEQIVVQPAVERGDGTIETPAIFRTDTRQEILRERGEVEFETPCAPVLTPQFIASVQRALLARGYYAGAITGTLDASTNAAIQRYQIAQGDVNTGTLTLRTARTLGLVALPRDQL